MAWPKAWPIRWASSAAWACLTRIVEAQRVRHQTSAGYLRGPAGLIGTDSRTLVRPAKTALLRQQPIRIDGLIDSTAAPVAVSSRKKISAPGSLTPVSYIVTALR